MFIQNRTYNPNYTPKKAVKKFTDLEVYQKSLEGSVFVANEITKALKHKNIKALKQESKTTKKQKSVSAPQDVPVKAMEAEINIDSEIIKNMTPCAMSIPHLIAESHSKRFGSSTECLKILDEVMLRCNKMVVYLEQTRDICQTGVETERFEEQINKYFYIRRKVLNLQRVWKKYIKENES